MFRLRFTLKCNWYNYRPKDISCILQRQFSIMRISVLILIFVFFWAEYLSKLQINPVIRDRLFDFKL
jgi:hypothetical protein